MEFISIKKVGIEELAALQTISRVTFAQTFDAHNSPEDMQNYLNTSFATDKLKAELSNPESEFYFAKAGDTIIGYLKVNTGAAQTELKAAMLLRLNVFMLTRPIWAKK
jgi:hypothetical protein